MNSVKCGMVVLSLLLVITIAFSYDIDVPPQDYGVGDGFCYEHYTMHGVTPDPYVDYGDNDFDCCELPITGVGTNKGYGGRWDKSDALNENCCGDDPGESWCGLAGACSNGNYYVDADDNPFACDCDGSKWLGAGSEYACCDYGTYDEVMDNFIIRQVDSTHSEIIWAGEVLVESVSVSVETGIAQNGVWTAGTGALCVSDVDCLTDFCSGDNWVDYSCVSNRCTSTSVCSVSNDCAECCHNVGVLLKSNDCNAETYDYGSGSGALSYAKSYACHLAFATATGYDYGYFLSGSYMVCDLCSGLRARYIGSDRVACCTTLCGDCLYRCHMSYNPNFCVADYGKGNICTGYAKRPCESDEECRGYFDDKLGVNPKCTIKPIPVPDSGRPVQERWCKGKIVTDIFDYPQPYSCETRHLTPRWKSSWGCAYGYYTHGTDCDTYSWGSTYEQEAYNPHDCSCDTCYETCCEYCNFQHKTWTGCGFYIVCLGGCTGTTGWTSGSCWPECGDDWCGIIPTCTGFCADNTHGTCCSDCNPYNCNCDTCYNYRNKRCSSDANCASGYKCDYGNCRAYNWNNNYQTYDAYYVKYCRDVLIYKDDDAVVDADYTLKDLDWTYGGYIAGVSVKPEDYDYVISPRFTIIYSYSSVG